MRSARSSTASTARATSSSLFPGAVTLLRRLLSAKNWTRRYVSSPNDLGLTQTYPASRNARRIASKHSPNKGNTATQTLTPDPLHRSDLLNLSAAVSYAWKRKSLARCDGNCSFFHIPSAKLDIGSTICLVRWVTDGDKLGFPRKNREVVLTEIGWQYAT